MLFFIDETWQELGGQQVGALGAVAIPQASYNRFCREVFAIKQKVLGAKELSDAELKGAKCFANRAFRARETDAGSKLSRLIEIPQSCLWKFPTWLSVQHRLFWRGGSVAV